MSNLVLYLFESSGILIVLYLLYRALLSKETFFSFNRFFLLAILAISVLLPLLRVDVPSLKDSVVEAPLEKLTDIRTSYYDALATWSYDAANGVSPKEIAPNGPGEERAKNQRLLIVVVLAIYGTGVVVLLLRLIGSYRWIRRLKRSNRQEIVHGLTVVRVPRPIAPFSFWNTVFVGKDVIHQEDLDQILAHEKIHLREGHSLDLLIVQLAAAGFWFNPAVWWLIKSLKTTHEYIVDKKMIDQGHPMVTYQTLLLSQLVSNHSYGLVHHFNLSFIKRRIVMMNAKRSGWTGNVKVALVLSAVAAVSLLIVQCDARVDEPGLLEPASTSAAVVSHDVKVPVLPESGYQLDGDPSKELSLTISGDKVVINGNVVEVDQIASVLEEESAERNIVVARIDRDQSMALVRTVQDKLREAGRLKLLYIGQTAAGEPVEMPFLLPPAPEDASAIQQPIITEQYAAENDIDLLKVNLGDNAGSANQQMVYDFVKEQMAAQKSNYVVSARFSDTDSYDDYLTNLCYLKEGFYQIYDERAQAMYGMSFWDIFKNRGSDEEYAAMYDALRQGVPMAISVAED